MYMLYILSIHFTKHNEAVPFSFFHTLLKVLQTVDDKLPYMCSSLLIFRKVFLFLNDRIIVIGFICFRIVKK